VNAADDTAGMELESVNMMVVRVISDSIFDLLLLFLQWQLWQIGSYRLVLVRRRD
jgi:hypothetical protein